MDKQRRLQKFSIRKYAVGTCSILIGTLIFLGSPADHAFASENTLDVAKQEESAKENEEKEIIKTVEEADKSSEENKQQNEETSTNQPTTEETAEQSISEETDKQQVEVEKSVTTEETVKPEESVNNENAADKQESTVKEEKVEEVEKPKTKEVAEKETKTENPATKEEQPKNETVKSEDKSDEKSQKETEKSEDKSVEKEKTNKDDVVVEQPATTENKQVSDEVVQPEIKENTQSEKKTTETEEKPVKSDTPDKAGVVTEQPREERRTRTRRSLRSIDNSMFRSDSADVPKYNTGISQEIDYDGNGRLEVWGRFPLDDQYAWCVDFGLQNVRRQGNNAIIRYEMRFNHTPENKKKFASRGPIKYYFGATEGTIKVLRVEKNGSPLDLSSVKDDNLEKTFRAKNPSGYNFFANDRFTPITTDIKSISGRGSDKFTVEFEVTVPLSRLLNEYESQPYPWKHKAFHIAAGAWSNSYNYLRYKGVHNTDIKPNIETDLTEKANTKTPIVVSAVPGVTVKLYAPNNQVIGEGRAGLNGQATITPTVNIPAGNITAKIVVTQKHNDSDDPPRTRELQPSNVRIATPRVTDAERLNPTGKNQTVELKGTPDAEQSINTTGLPSGTRYEYTSPVDTRTAGDKNATVRVTYPDGSHDDVPVVVEVEDNTPPVGPNLNYQRSEKGVAIGPITLPKATDNSGEINPTSVTGLPAGLTYNSQTRQITGTPTAEGNNKVIVTYRDPSGNSVTKTFQYEVVDTTAPPKPVIQTDLTEKAGTTTPISVTAEPGSTVRIYTGRDNNKVLIGEGTANAQGNVTITPTRAIPAGEITATATDKAVRPNTSVPSEPKVATNRPTDAERLNPTGKKQTVELKATPNAEQSINTAGLPSGTRYAYTTPVDTRTTGDKNATVRVTYPDGSHDDVAVVVAVNDTMRPTAPDIKEKRSEKGAPIQAFTLPNATDNSGEINPTSVTGLPAGLTYNSQTRQITGTPTTEGTSTVTVTYRDPSGNSVTKEFIYKVIDSTPPAKPVIETDLTGKATKKEPITV
ncbi:Rib/alpha-like domain-containing protein, partial [Mammaliicoccus lentus]|uniref:Rib/alpha-like domain-containing protein n=1 Tax=Mammaliicoccus lentus TaxID=42858 RepID=UPI0011C98633